MCSWLTCSREVTFSCTLLFYFIDILGIILKIVYTREKKEKMYTWELKKWKVVVVPFCSLWGCIPLALGTHLPWGVHWGSRPRGCWRLRRGIRSQTSSFMSSFPPRNSPEHQSFPSPCQDFLSCTLTKDLPIWKLTLAKLWGSKQRDNYKYHIEKPLSWSPQKLPLIHLIKSCISSKIFFFCLRMLYQNSLFL